MVLIGKYQAIIYKGDFFRSMIFLHGLWLAIFMRETRMTLQAMVLKYLPHTELKTDFPMAYLLLSPGIKEYHKKIPAPAKVEGDLEACKSRRSKLVLAVSAEETSFVLRHKTDNLS